jgi:polyphosphate kinase
VPYLHDRLDAWQLDGEGRYRRVAEGGIGAQQALMRRHS